MARWHGGELRRSWLRRAAQDHISGDTGRGGGGAGGPHFHSCRRTRKQKVWVGSQGIGSTSTSIRALFVCFLLSAVQWRGPATAAVRILVTAIDESVTTPPNRRWGRDGNSRLYHHLENGLFFSLFALFFPCFLQLFPSLFPSPLRLPCGGLFLSFVSPRACSGYLILVSQYASHIFRGAIVSRTFGIRKKLPYFTISANNIGSY